MYSLITLGKYILLHVSTLPFLRAFRIFFLSSLLSEEFIWRELVTQFGSGFSCVMCLSIVSLMVVVSLSLSSSQYGHSSRK